MALGKLGGGAVFVSSHHRGQVDVYWDLPAEGLIEKDVLRRRGDELRAADDMGNAHEVVVHDVGEIVRGHPVALDEYLILQFSVVDGDGAVHDVVKGGAARQGHLLTNDIGISCVQVLFHICRIEVAAAPVIAGKALVGAPFLRIAETAVGEALFHQFFRVFLINFLSFALDVWPAVAADVWPFVGENIGFGQRPLDEVHGVRHVTGPIRVLDAQEEITPLGFGEKISVKRRPQVADVHVPRGAWRKAGAYSRQWYDLPIP